MSSYVTESDKKNEKEIAKVFTDKFGGEALFTHNKFDQFDFIWKDPNGTFSYFEVKQMNYSIESLPEFFIGFEKVQHAQIVPWKSVLLMRFPCGSVGWVDLLDFHDLRISERKYNKREGDVEKIQAYFKMENVNFI